MSERPVLVAGPAYCDLIFAGLPGVPPLGQEWFADSLTVTAGGSAITAVAFARLGVPVALLAQVGTDAHGGIVRNLLEQEGVLSEALHVKEGAYTPVTAALSSEHDRAFATFLPEGRPDVEASLAALKPRHVHLAGFPAVAWQAGWVETLHTAGVTVSFDPGWSDEALADPAVRDLAFACDVLMPSRQEALRLLDLPLDSDLASSRVVGALAEARPSRITVVKDGANGAWAVGLGGGEPWHVRVEPAAAVDTTGAGDVFDAAFLAAWLDGEPVAVCLKWGALAGRQAVGRIGGSAGAPTRDELNLELAHLEASA